MGTGTSGTVKVPVPGIFHFSGGNGTSVGKFLYRKRVLEPVLVKLGIEKKSRSRYWKNVVPKKALVLISQIFGIGKKSIGIGMV